MSSEDGIYDLVVDATVAEKTIWGLTTVYRLVSNQLGVEVKLTLTNSEVGLPLKEGDVVVIGVSWELLEDEDEVPMPPDGTGGSFSDALTMKDIDEALENLRREVTSEQ